MLNLKQKNKILDLCLGVVLLVLGFEILFYHSAVINCVNTFVTKASLGGWFAIAILQYLQVIFIPVPATFITLASMKMYPNELYLLYAVTLGVTILGVVTAYFIGRKWGKKAVIWCAGSEEEYHKWLIVLKSKKTNLVYLATVLLPIFPDDILCILAGSIKMNFWVFLAINLVGRAIGLATFIFTFTVISNSIWTIVVLGILSVVLITLKIILKRKLKNESISNRK